MTINEADVQAARRILDDHAARFGDLPTLQSKAVESPEDHPDNDKTFDDDMGVLDSLAFGVEYFLHFCGGKITGAAETIYEQMIRENDVPQQMRDRITVFGVIGGLIKDWT